MKALTLWPEWAHAIAYLGKDVENRTWAPPERLRGEDLLIHAGARIGGRPGRRAAQEGVDALASMCERAGLLPIAAGHDPDDPDEINFLVDGFARRIVRRAIVARVRYEGPMTDSSLIHHPGQASPWYVGPIGWRLRLMETYDPPIPCQRGAQGIWTFREAA